MRPVTPTFRQPWEPPFYSEASIAILRQHRRENRHPHPGISGNHYSPSRVGKARAEAALALETAGNLRRAVALKYDSGTPPGALRYGRRWYEAFRDAAGWRCRAEDALRRGAPHDLAATSGHRLKTVGDLARLKSPVRLLGTEAWTTWEWDVRDFKHGSVWDRLRSRSSL